jgi:hypothetical protein
VSKILTYLFLFFVANLTVEAQYFSTGEDPAHLKWRQISTVNFQLIYPENFEQQAQKLANYFEQVYRHGNNSLKHKPRKISIIFHTHTVRSNGLVGWAPRRMELFTPPHQATYGQDWLEQLAIHEFRHVVQVDKIHSQLPGIINFLLGEQGSALVTGAYLPFWFIEGDAVVTETALSQTGRGRLPSFLMEHKAQVVEKGVFSLDKAFNRSYRDFVPDHYKLGYHLVGESRARYGPGLWDNAIDNVTRNPFSLTPLNRSLRKQTGFNQEKLYRSIFDSLKIQWIAEDLAYDIDLPEIISKPQPVFANYTHKHFLPSGDVLSLKESYDDIPRFVIIRKDRTETKVCTPGQILDESVSFHKNRVVWSEFVPDARWTHSGRSRINIYDVETRQKISFFPEFKCFAPVISPDEQYVAAIEVDFENNYYLSVYNATSGALVKRYQTPENNYMYSPAWQNNQEIAVILLAHDGKQIARVNPTDGTLEFLPGTGMGEIKHLIYSGSDLYFISGYSGRDELWKLAADKKITRITRARFGHAYPAISEDSKNIILSDYTSDGYRLIQFTNGNLSVEPKEMVTVGEFPLARILAGQEAGKVNFMQSDTLRYMSAPYSKAGNLLKFHSWAPLVLDVDSYEIQPGFSLASQNLLGTADLTMGYKWNMSEKAGKPYVNFEYRGWYPIFSIEAEAGKRASSYNQITVYKNAAGEIVRQDTALKRFSWNERNFGINGRIPINLTKGAYFRLLQPEVRFDQIVYDHTTSTPSGFVKGDMQTMAYRLYFHQIIRQAYRDVLPEWGIIGDLSFRHSFEGAIDVGTMSAGQIRAFVPGLSANHGTVLYAGAQSRVRGEKYGFSNVVRMPRGWHSIDNNKLTTVSLEYRFPIAYPDMNIGRWIYFRRLKASLFGDYARIMGNTYKDGEITGNFSRNLSSLGIDLTSDINILRLYAPADAGIRAAYLPETSNFSFEFLFSIDFTSF